MKKARVLPPLIGRSVTLRAVEREDFPTLSELRNDLSVQASLLAVAKPNSPARVRAWIERRAADEEGVFFVIAKAQDRRAVGFIQATGIDPLHRVAELGICITEQGRGRDFGREAITLLEGYLASTFRVRKIWLRVDTGNASGLALYASCGFRKVGTLLKHHYAGGRYRDVVLMEKLFTKDRSLGT